MRFHDENIDLTTKIWSCDDGHEFMQITYELHDGGNEKFNLISWPPLSFHVVAKFDFPHGCEWLVLVVLLFIGIVFYHHYVMLYHVLLYHYCMLLALDGFGTSSWDTWARRVSKHFRKPGPLGVTLPENWIYQISLLMLYHVFSTCVYQVLRAPLFLWQRDPHNLQSLIPTN